MFYCTIEQTYYIEIKEFEYGFDKANLILKVSTTIQDVIAELQTRYGPQVVQRLSDFVPSAPQPTSIPDLDTLLGGGLLPGVLTVLQGGVTSGRVTLAQRILAHSPQTISIYIDACSTFDLESATRNGVNLTRIVIVHPGEQLLEILSGLLSLRVPFVVLDESDAKQVTTLPAVLITQLAQAGTVLLQLPPDRQTPLRAGARLMVEKLEWIRCPQSRDIRGCRSRVIVFEQRGVAFGAHVTLDLMLDDR